MSRNNAAPKKTPFPKAVVIGVAVAMAVAVTCFTAVAVLPATKQPFFDSPLRSFLTGLGLAGVACPLCIAGSLLRRRSARSPYFEEAFMAGVLNLFGYIAATVAVLCLGLAAYALLHRLLRPR
jgi:hypothetical protein